jgi:acyl-coenzyme A synthetase/AMP-(fatty) acid ligase
MIYIDGIEYLESDNDRVRSAVIDYLENWTVNVSTSGTTGEPKVLQHDAKLMIEIAEYNAEYLDLTSNSTMMSLYNPRGIGFTSMSLYPCAVANCDVFIETTVSNYPDRLKEINPTHTLILPNVWKTWHRHKKWKALDLSNLKHMQVGSDVTPNGLMEDLRSKGAQKVTTAYGSTEVPPIIMSTEKQDIYHFNDIHPQIDYKNINHDDGSIEWVCKWKNQKEYWHSGDLIEYTDDGEFYFAGRRHNMFKMENCGDRIYPEQIEKVAVDSGADLALCRKVRNECIVYYTGEMNVQLFLKEHRCNYEIIPKKVQHIEVDDNLRKVKRNQEIVTSAA